MSALFRRALPVVLVLSVLTGCGSRLSQDELVALNGGTATVEPGAGPATAPDVPVPGALPAPGELPAATPGAGAASANPGQSAGGPATAGSASAQPLGPGAGTGGKPGGAAQSAVKTDNKPLTVCSVSELGGPAGAALAQAVNGLQAWLGDVNARGGVAGHPIRLIVKDSGSDPQVALSHARACVENEGAIALVGSIAPFTSRGMMPYLQSKGIPAIGGDCGSSAWNDSPVMFNQCPSVETNYWYLAYEAAHAGAANNKLGFLYCQEAQTCAEGKKWWIEENFPKQNGLDMVYAKQFSLTQLDFTSECSAMKAAGVSVVMSVADPSALQRLGQSCARQGFNPIWSQPFASVNPDTPTKAGLANIVLGMPAMPFCCITGKDADIPVYKRYQTAFQRYGGSRPPGPAAPLGFTAGLLFERFLTEVAKTTPTVTPAALLKAAGGIRNETLGGAVGPMTLTVGQKTPDSRCWFVMVARDGGAFTVPNGMKQTCRK